MKKFISIALAVCLLFGALSIAGCGKKEQAYPSKTIELVIPYKAGGASDITARMFATYLEKELGQTITITNMGGGGTVEGMTYAYNQPSDGYTLMSSTNSVLSKQAQKASDIVFTEAFDPICNMCKDVGILAVRSDSPFNTMDDVIAYAKEHPGEVTISGVSAGAGDEMCSVQLNKGLGIELSYIPYEGSSEAKAAVLGGECVILNDKIISVSSLIESGDLKPLMTLTQTRISTIDYLKDIPCVKDYNVVTAEIWRGMAVKADVPADVKDTLIAACKRVQDNPEWQAWLADQNLNILEPERDMAKIKDAYLVEVDENIAFYDYLASK